jgi:threonine/homoserine efflux transporter RhtA
MNDSSRTQGGLICIAVVVLGAWFLLALLQESYWAIALPVAIIVFFVLGLTFWIGYTIATIRVEPIGEPEPPETGASETPIDAAQPDRAGAASSEPTASGTDPS